MNVNMKGLFFCLKHEIIQMQKQGKGAIVNTRLHRRPEDGPRLRRYGPSKAGAIALTRLAAMENARPASVNVICPGPTTGTDLMNNTLSTNPAEEALPQGARHPHGQAGHHAGRGPRRRLAVLDFSGYITGQAFPWTAACTSPDRFPVAFVEEVSMLENRYPHVFQPLTIRGVTLKNRLQYAPTVVLRGRPPTAT